MDNDNGFYSSYMSGYENAKAKNYNEEEEDDSLTTSETEDNNDGFLMII